jgi:hypothetical protein
MPSVPLKASGADCFAPPCEPEAPPHRVVGCAWEERGVDDQDYKVDAAKCQLQKEITLWFKDEDPVSIHTLVFAAYEVSHSVSKKRDPNRRDLLFDTLWIKDECRSDR